MDFSNLIVDKTWYQRYRPQSVKDIILPAAMKKELLGYVEDGFVPSLLLAGQTGTGKSSIAHALMKDIGADYMTLNSSMYGDIDTVRTSVMQFASTVSLLDSDHKYIIFEEADGITPRAFEAIRVVFEEFSNNCSFILTANRINKIPVEVQGRCIKYDMVIPKAEKSRIASEMFVRVTKILENEGITYEREVVGALVTKFFPNWRALINTLQKYAKGGTIDTGILASEINADWADLFKAVKSKDFTKARKWVAEYADVESASFYRQFYDNLTTQITDSSIPALVVTIAEYQFKEMQVIDPEINRAAFLAEVMASVAFR